MWDQTLGWRVGDLEEVPAATPPLGPSLRDRPGGQEGCQPPLLVTMSVPDAITCHGPRATAAGAEGQRPMLSLHNPVPALPCARPASSKPPFDQVSARPPLQAALGSPTLKSNIYRVFQNSSHRMALLLPVELLKL